MFGHNESIKVIFRRLFLPESTESWRRSSPTLFHDQLSLQHYRFLPTLSDKIPFIVSTCFLFSPTNDRDLATFYHMLSIGPRPVYVTDESASSFGSSTWIISHSNLGFDHAYSSVACTSINS